MPLPLYLIGPLQFHGWKGTPGLPEVQIGGEQRPAVNGASVFDLGTWGEPCQVHTVAGFLTWQQAWQAWVQYPRLADLGPQFVTIAGYTIQGGKYQVLKVEGAVSRLARFDVATDASLYTAAVRATWTMLPLADVANL